MITNDPLLRAEEIRLTEAKTKVWNDCFAAESAAYPPTLKNILWIVAKSGYTKVVAPFMILSKATRECKNLQRVMREVMNRYGMTQLFYFCWKGMTSSVKRMLEMKSINVEARGYEREDGETCLMIAANDGHLGICRLLIDKGAHLEAKDINGWTPLILASWEGHLEIARLLCDHGADIEARDEDGMRPLHLAATYGHISIVKDLIEVRNAEINARNDSGWTALRYARDNDNADIVSFLVSHGGIE